MMIYSDLFDIDTSHSPIIAAHRGRASGNIPCNTLPAFDIAIREGAQIVELDVTRSRDGKLFVFHPYKDFAHLGKIMLIQNRVSSAVASTSYLNFDRKPTQYPVVLLDEALEHLRGRCIINIDKFWEHPREIMDAVERHEMRDCVIAKAPCSKRNIDLVAGLASSVPFMPMLGEHDDVDIDYALSKGLNVVAAELLFSSDDSKNVSSDFMAKLQSRGILCWGNSIVYDYRAVISAGHTDDVAVCGNPDFGWGWFAEHGFDILQTDWVLEMVDYFSKRQD